MNNQRFVLIFLVITMALLAIACSSAAPAASPSPTSTPTPALSAGQVEERVSEIIGGLDADDSASLDRVEDLVRMGRPGAEHLLPLLESPVLLERWAAGYYFSRLAEPSDIPQLAAALADSHVSNRTVVAGTLLRLGDRRGVSILQDALNSELSLAFSHPPRSLADYAHGALQALSPADLPVAHLPDSAASFNRLASLLPAPQNDIEVSSDDCVFTFTINLQYYGPGASQELADRFTEAIIKMWDGKFSKNGCTFRIKVNTKVGGLEDPDYAQIEVADNPAAGTHRANMTLGNSGRASDIRGQIANTDDPAVMAHEVGHALGCDDEYKDNAEGYSEPVGDAVGEGDGAGAQPSIMAQTWKDGEGDLPAAKTRHIDAFFKAYGVVCNEDCSLTFAERRMALTATAAAHLRQTPTATATPTRTPVPTPSPAYTVTAIRATFDPPAQTTNYSVGFENPEGRELDFRWSQPECGYVSDRTMESSSAVGTVEYDWNHPHPPCDPTTGHDHVTITLVVQERDYVVTCQYKGASTGTGEPCEVKRR